VICARTDELPGGHCSAVSLCLPAVLEGGVGLTRLMASMLFGVKPSDLITFAERLSCCSEPAPMRVADVHTNAKIYASSGSTTRDSTGDDMTIEVVSWPKRVKRSLTRSRCAMS
jgi:hypothetical protein